MSHGKGPNICSAASDAHDIVHDTVTKEKIIRRHWLLGEWEEACVDHIVCTLAGV